MKPAPQVVLDVTRSGTLARKFRDRTPPEEVVVRTVLLLPFLVRVAGGHYGRWLVLGMRLLARSPVKLGSVVDRDESQLPTPLNETLTS